MQWRSWRRHFEANRARALPGGLERFNEAAPEWRDTLRSSLARLQLGETGEGRIAHEIDSARLPGIDADYRAALKLFVAEEGRHARILGQIVREMGGELLARTWTERLFVFGRRLMGLRLKLTVLLVAEVVASGLFDLLASRLPEGALRRALEEIAGDETHHLRFHSDFFARQGWGPAMRAAWWVMWWPLALAASAVVLLDHWRTLRALGIPPHEAARTFMERAAEAVRRALFRVT